jgi:thioredoxin:protein disulfide reductase
MRCLKNLVLTLCLWCPVSFAASDFLDPEVAFSLQVSALDSKRIQLQFGVAPGYHLYRDKLGVSALPAGLELGSLEVPKGTIEFDPNFEKNLEIFKAPVAVTLPLAQPVSQPFKLIVLNQGCADQGLCYAPQERAFRIERHNGELQISPLSEAQAALWNPPPIPSITTPAPTKAIPPSAPTGFASALQSGQPLKIIGAFFLAGLLLSFTPCVLPMVPILSSIIVGQSTSGKVSKSKGLGLAAAYALGMALVYSALGIAAGLAGEGLAAALQNPWVLVAFALLLGTLSLSMFGAYELQMPSGVQTRLTQFSTRLQGGQYAGVFVMGAISALIVGPCVAAPLAGALVYISQTRDVVLGGTALFALACGMSVPLLLIGISAGQLLPRAGGWMERVKHFFGLMLMCVALWMVWPVLPAWALMVCAGTLLLGVAVYLGAFERAPSPISITPAHAVTKGLGLLLAIAGSLQLVGAASGGTHVMQPLAHLLGHSTPAAASPEPSPWRTVADTAALDAAVAASPLPVLVDFYADWCVACKELETFTFSKPAIQERFKKFTLLRVDVTANTASDKALMRKYQIFGPPALLFFAPQGAELSAQRLVGFHAEKAMAAHLDMVIRQLPSNPTIGL